MTDLNDNYELVLSFDSDDPQFARGFEAGKIYAELKLDSFAYQESLTVTVHHENTEMMMRIAEALNLSFSATELDEGFTSVSFTRSSQ